MKAIMDLVDEINSDSQGFEKHNFTSVDSTNNVEIPEYERKWMYDVIKYTLDDEPMSTDSNPATINLFVLKNHPERFSDLKSFFPKIEYDLTTHQATILEVPDITFGRLLEWTKEPSFPSPLIREIVKMYISTKRFENIIKSPEKFKAFPEILERNFKKIDIKKFF